MKTLNLLILLFAFVLSQGQDSHFSNIHASPLNNNPAWLGVFQDDFRFISNYRNQWKSVSTNLNTVSVSIEAKYAPPSNAISFSSGFSFLSDRGGDLNYGTNNYSFLGGTSVALNRYKTSFISTGVQLSFVRQFIDVSNAVTLDQEPIFNQLMDQNNFDISIGVGYYFVPKEDRSMYVGIGIFHINNANVSLINDQNITQDKRYVLNFGGDYLIKRKTSAQPSFIMYWQGPHREINMGSYFSVMKSDYTTYSDKKLNVYIGAWARYYINPKFNSGFDALILATKVDYNKMSVAVSMDVTLSKLTRAKNYIASPELSFMYSFSKKSSQNGKSKIKCPKF